MAYLWAVELGQSQNTGAPGKNTNQNFPRGTLALTDLEQETKLPKPQLRMSKFDSYGRASALLVNKKH